MVDSSLARQIARLAGSAAPSAELDADPAAAAPGAAEQVARYTGLRSEGALPATETVDRSEWAEINIEALGTLLDPVVERLGERLSGTGPLGGALRLATEATLAAEVGLVMGYLSQRVLGQYELALLRPERPARLLLVGPNLAQAVSELEVDRDSFLAWIVLHELTHALQFAGVPWLRDYLGGLLREYLATVDVRIDRSVVGDLRSLPSPAELVAAFNQGGLATLVQTSEQRRLMERLQAVMAVIEGYSEHVMDAVGAAVLPAYEGLREAMERRRRSRPALERALQRLLGLDLKLRQYELGKCFCDAVARERGVECLNLVWSSPEALPELSELEHPLAWIARMQQEPVAVP